VVVAAAVVAVVVAVVVDPLHSHKLQYYRSGCK
jgi:hypothetical protein